jgi:enoyl-CoA hydratase
MDDGKVNALSLEMFGELGDAFDRAKADRAAVLLRGRDGVFSAGFDLRVLRAGGASATELVRTGFELAERILAFPTPVVSRVPATRSRWACSSCSRPTIGSARSARTESARTRWRSGSDAVVRRRDLPPAPRARALLARGALAEMYAPEDAVAAGFLDRARARARGRCPPRARSPRSSRSSTSTSTPRPSCARASSRSRRSAPRSRPTRPARSPL